MPISILATVILFLFLPERINDDLMPFPTLTSEIGFANRPRTTIISIRLRYFAEFAAEKTFIKISRARMNGRIPFIFLQFSASSR